MKPFALAVSGVPCTGKTTLSGRLGPILGAKVIGLNELADEAGLLAGYDEARDTRIVDVKRLRAHLKNAGQGNVILDGLVSHLLDVTHILVLRCDPRLLQERMRERGYSREKMMENIEAEYSGIILYESVGRCRNVFEADNTSSVDVDEIRRWLVKGGRRVSEKDWTLEFRCVLESLG
ncbi:MAG: adenylate kinase family protein [Candidatus Altiarchaeota archaeon]